MSKCITIVGKRGCGKSTLARTLVKQYRRNHIIIINDYIGEYNGNVVRSYTDIRSNTINICRGLPSYTICDMAWQAGRVFDQPVLLVLDEIDIYGKHDPYIAHIYRYGRHRGISVIAISRRFYDLPVLVRSLTHAFHIFQITDERDISYIERNLSVPAEKIRKLKPYQYITIDL